MSFEKLQERFLFSQTRQTESKLKPLLHTFIPSDIVLEVGCGIGIELKEVSNLVCMAVGIDIDEKVLQLAKRYLGRQVHLIRADAHFLPFRSKQFSKVLCFDVLEHLLHPDLFINELKEVAMHDAKVYPLFRTSSRFMKHC